MSWRNSDCDDKNGLPESGVAANHGSCQRVRRFRNPLFRPEAGFMISLGFSEAAILFIKPASQAGSYSSQSASGRLPGASNPAIA